MQRRTTHSRTRNTSHLRTGYAKLAPIAGALLLAACAADVVPRGTDETGESGSAENAVTSSAFVSVQAGSDGHRRFYVDGAPLRFVGANINGLPWLPDWLIEQELDYAQSLGVEVIRVWGVDSTMSADVMAGRLRHVLDEAAERDLHVIIALTHNFHQPNWYWGAHRGVPPDTTLAVPGDASPNGFTSDARGFYSRPCGTLHCLSDSWIAWGFRAHYRGYAERLVSLLSDHQAVFGWDIANEVSVSAKGNDHLNGLLVDFYLEMARTIKAHDPNHLVTTGLISTGWPGLARVHEDWLYNSPDIDFVTIHEYVGWAGNHRNGEQQDQDIVDANTRWNKPVIVEEFGILHGTPDAPDRPATQRAIARYYDEHFAPGDDRMRVDGIMHFGVSTNEGFTDEVWYGAVRGWLELHIRSWSATLAAEGGSPEPAPEPTPEPTPEPGCGLLSPGATIEANGQLWSCDGRFLMAMQGDGNLVLYQAGVGALWSTGTAGRGTSRAVMQHDGHLVVYDAGGTPTWWSGTAGLRVRGLSIQNDGNAVIYDTSGRPVWQSGTCCR